MTFTNLLAPCKLHQKGLTFEEILLVPCRLNRLLLCLTASMWIENSKKVLRCQLLPGRIHISEVF